MSQSQLKKQRRLEREAHAQEKLRRAAEGELRGEPVIELPEADVVTITFRPEHWRGAKPGVA